MTATEHQARLEFARDVSREAGEIAARYFADRAALSVTSKGTQDWVSEADQNVETFLRGRIAEHWPEDGIYGEEHGPVEGRSGFDWVIDPIDGTTNFLNGIPAWVVVLAGISGGRTEIGVIHDPNAGETYSARRGAGAFLNGEKMQVAAGVGLASGTVAVGYSNRVEAGNIVDLVAALTAKGALFYRNASGALSLAYVASGRVLGYLEEHMNAWDCLAGQLMVAEAGGQVEDQDAGEMLRAGGRVIACADDVFEPLLQIAESAWAGQQT